MAGRKFVLPRRSGRIVSVDFAGDLNDQQRAAVMAGDGPKLVIAGAGTGKTRTLTYRVAWLLAQGIPPDRLLLVTFTNKAAREMVGRVEELTGLPAHRLWGGTFHSVGARILRRHAQRFGYTDSFSILDEADQRDLLRACIADLEIDVVRRRFPSPKVLRAMVSLQANTRVAWEDLLAERYPRFLDWEEEIVAVAARYGERKRAANAMDYDDLLLLWLRLLKDNEDLRAAYGEQFRHILVDEYQDTNLVQGEIVELLASCNGGNLMVVGDDCQSIYAFRGAHYANILEFPRRNPQAEVFKLEINYRSTPEILTLANASIRCNPGQYAKQLVAQRPSGTPPALVPCNYPEQEATFVAERMLQLREEGTALGRIAVLYRAHAHRLHLETTLLRYDIPYEVRGGVRFFEQAHVKDVTAHLRWIENPRDEVAFQRLLLLRPGIGPATVRRLWQALAPPADPDALVERMRAPELQRLVGARARASWKSLQAVVHSLAEARDDPEQAIRIVLEGGYAELAAARFTNYESRLEDLEQLALFAGQYASVRALLEELVLLGEMYGQDVAGGGGEEGRVVLSTIHQAKGLEWDVVFLIHLVEGALPSPRALDDEGGEQEERRIFYVAMTRARDELYLCYPIMRPGGGGALLQQPSRFLQELPEELMERWELSEADDAYVEPGPTVPSGGRARGRRRRSHWEQEWDPNVDPIWDDDEGFA